MGRRRRPAALGIRFKAAVAATAAVAVVLAVVFVVVVVLQRRALDRAVQQVAESQAERVASQLAGRPLDRATLDEVTGAQESLIQILDATGSKVVGASEPLRGQPALIRATAGTQPVQRRLGGLRGGEGGSFVIVSVPVQTADGTVHVVTAESLEDAETATSTAIRLLGVGYPLLLLLVAGISYWLTGRALAPVERMRRRVAEISAADLSARVPTAARDDEIGRLGRTMNEMLARLESAAAAQRGFVSDASHELKSPVATIKTIHEVAQSFPRSTDWAEAGPDVLRETARLEGLIADLLLLARGEELAHPGPYAPVALHRVVRSEAGRRRRVPVEISVEEARVLGREDDVRRALRNLLDNAERHARSRIWVDLSSDQSEVSLTVRDDGAGVEPADRERVFDRFVRLDESRSRDGGGSGLGLAITRQIVRSQGGDVVILAGDPGAVVRITWPLQDRSGGS